MCRYASLPTYGKEYRPCSQNSRADTSRDQGYVKPPSTDFLQIRLAQLVSASDFWARRIGFSIVLGQKKTIFWTLKSLASNALLLEISFNLIWEWRISNFCLIIVLPYHRPTLSLPYLIIPLPYHHSTLSSFYLIIILPYHRHQITYVRAGIKMCK